MHCKVTSSSVSGLVVVVVSPPPSPLVIIIVTIAISASDSSSQSHKHDNDGIVTTAWRTRLNRRQAIGASLQKIRKSHSTDFNEDTTNESASLAYSNIRL